MRCGSPAALLLLVLAGCGGSGGADPSAGDEQAESDETGGETDGDAGDETALGDRCEDTTLIIEAPTRIEASLRNASAPDESIDQIGASCGLTGPTVFVKATLDSRADLSVVAHGRAYSAKVAVLRPGCTADPARVLACGETLPVTLTDIGPDVELLIAIGIDQADPALALPASDDHSEGDPLDFELRLEASPILAEHSICGRGYGRCEPGTVCLPDAPDDLPDGDGPPTEHCRRPPADSCLAPGVLAVPSPGTSALIEILPDEAHSDAHEHPCTGWRRPERVELLELPAGLGDSATLEIHADDPRVGLALRRSSCLPEDTLACAPATAAGDNGTTLSLAAAGLPDSLLLFIELPRPEPDGREAPVPLTVSVELFD